MKTNARKQNVGIVIALKCRNNDMSYAVKCPAMKSLQYNVPQYNVMLERPHRQTNTHHYTDCKKPEAIEKAIDTIELLVIIIFIVAATCSLRNNCCSGVSHLHSGTKAKHKESYVSGCTPLSQH